MANMKIATTPRNDMMDALAAYVGTSAKMELWSGTQPAGGGTPTGALLAVLTCNVSAFAGSSAGGVLTLNPITGTTALGSGTVTWARVTQSGGSWGFDGDVTQPGGGGDFEIDEIVLTIGGDVTAIGTHTLTAPNPA